MIEKKVLSKADHSGQPKICHINIADCVAEAWWAHTHIKFPCKVALSSHKVPTEKRRGWGPTCGLGFRVFNLGLVWVGSNDPKFIFFFFPHWFLLLSLFFHLLHTPLFLQCPLLLPWPLHEKQPPCEIHHAMAIEWQSVRNPPPQSAMAQPSPLFNNTVKNEFWNLIELLELGWLRSFQLSICLAYFVTVVDRNWALHLNITMKSNATFVCCFSHQVRTCYRCY